MGKSVQARPTLPEPKRALLWFYGGNSDKVYEVFLERDTEAVSLPSNPPVPLWRVRAEYGRRMEGPLCLGFLQEFRKTIYKCRAEPYGRALEAFLLILRQQTEQGYRRFDDVAPGRLARANVVEARRLWDRDNPVAQRLQRAEEEEEVDWQGTVTGRVNRSAARVRPKPPATPAPAPAAGRRFARDEDDI